MSFEADLKRLIALLAQEEEEEEVSPPPRRRHGNNGYFSADTYTASFRAVPGVHHGPQQVTPDDTIGTLTECWCGLPYGHSWPGKAQGKKHPKGITGIMQIATDLDRGSLRAYHKTIQDFILHEIRVHGLKFRVNKNAVLLYPPDGTPPMSVYARNTDRQLRTLAQWHAKHVEPHVTTPADVNVEDAARALAERINDPIEHPVPKSGLEISVEEARHRADDPLEQAYEEAAYEEPVQTDSTPIPAGWTQHIGTNGDAIEGIITNGKVWRCLLCVGTDHPWERNRPIGIGGHRRMWHTPGSDAFRARRKERGAAGGRAAQAVRRTAQAAPSSRYGFTPEDHRKQGAAKTRNAQTLRAAKQALEQMCAALGYYPRDPHSIEGVTATPGDGGAGQRVADLEADLAAAIRRADDVEAKWALAREAMGL